jgi:hypothetical protein
MLPPTISFSPVHIPTADSNSALSLSKRDLYDARFQLVASNSGHHEQELELDAENLKIMEAPSDLIPGIYEGGLKTWECSVDLASYLHNLLTQDDLLGKRILEVCFIHANDRVLNSFTSLGVEQPYLLCVFYEKSSTIHPNRMIALCYTCKTLTSWSSDLLSSQISS